MVTRNELFAKAIISDPAQFIEGASGTFYKEGLFVADHGEIYHIDWDQGIKTFIEFTKIENHTSTGITALKSYEE